MLAGREERTGFVLSAGFPIRQFEAAEAAEEEDIPFYRTTPRFHHRRRPTPMDLLYVLHQFVLPLERSLFPGRIATQRTPVGRKMLLIHALPFAEHTPRVFHRTVRHTHPFPLRKVHRLLVPLPIVLLLEVVRAECTLVLPRGARRLAEYRLRDVLRGVALSLSAFAGSPAVQRIYTCG